MTRQQVAEGGSRPLPTGTVTFLFSDIEGSTQRWETNRDDMRVAVAHHEQLVRAAIEHHQGYVFKTIGDAFCATFRTAPDAVRAAVEMQRVLAAQDFSAIGGLRVRIGIHAGHADERDGDYFGPAVNRVSRLMAIGHGGQILLSGATHALVASDMPNGVSLVDLGSHRLKDLTNPEQVWQAVASDAVRSFPPLRSLDALPHNLPIQHTSFRGRERDVDEVKKLVREHNAKVLAERIGEERRLTLALNFLASGCLQTGRIQRGADIAAEAIPLARTLGNKAILATLLAQSALFSWALGDIELARKSFDEGLALSAKLEDEFISARIRGNFAEFEFTQGNAEKALIRVLEAIAVYTRLKNYDFLTTYNNNSAAYRIALGDLTGAYEALIEGARWAREAQSAFDISVACQHLALIAALCGRLQKAARILGFVNAQYEELGLQREYTEKWSFDKLIALLSGGLTDNEMGTLLSEGATLPWEQAVDEALRIGKPDQE